MAPRYIDGCMTTVCVFAAHSWRRSESDSDTNVCTCAWRQGLDNRPGRSTTGYGHYHAHGTIQVHGTIHTYLYLYRTPVHTVRYRYVSGLGRSEITRIGLAPIAALLIHQLRVTQQLVSAKRLTAEQRLILQIRRCSAVH